MRSPTRFSRSRLGRLASSSSIVGIATIPQWPRSPRNHPRSTRISMAVSSRSVLARLCSRETATLLEWMIWVSIPRPLNHLASQKPSRPASKATAMQAMIRPFRTASSRQRCSTRSSSASSGAIFFNGCRSIPGMPGNQPARLTQLDDSNQRGGLIKGNERAAQVINLGHGIIHQILSSDDDAKPPAARPIASSDPKARRQLSRHGPHRLYPALVVAFADRPARSTDLQNLPHCIKRR